VLGASTRQWNLPIPDGRGTTQNQILLASARGLFDHALDPAADKAWPKLVRADDRRASLTTRARSYLDANCSQCHRQGNIVQVGFDARFSVPLEKQGLIRGPIRYPGVPRPDEYLVVPKDVERSRIHARVASLRMPPLGHVLPDEQGIALLRDWILELDGQPALTEVNAAVEPGRRPGTWRVRLHHADPRAVIHFVGDGGAPSPKTARYTGPIEIEGGSTLRAIAYREGFVPSRMLTRRLERRPRPGPAVNRKGAARD